MHDEPCLPDQPAAGPLPGGEPTPTADPAGVPGSARVPAAPAHGTETTRVPALGPRGEGWLAIQAVLFIALVVASAAGPAWDDPWQALGRATGVVLGLAGLGVVALGLAGLRSDLTPFPRPVRGGRFVDRGVYGVVRHPIYAGIVAAGIGWGLVSASPAALAVAAVLGVFFDVKARREEAWLLATYPAYAEYRRRVRKLVPLVY